MADRLLIRTPSTPATTFDADATNIINRMVSAGGSVTQGRRASINQTILDIKAGNSWNGLDALVIFGAGIESVALLNWKQNAFNPTIVVQPEFIAWNGYKGDGATTYIDSNFNPSTAGGNYSRDNACFGFTILSQQSSICFGSLNNFISSTTFRINQAGSTSTSGVASVNSVSFGAKRTGASATEYFQNGINVLSGSEASVALENHKWAICARNNAGTIDQFSPNLIGAYWIGDGTINQKVMHDYVTRYLRGIGALLPNY
jgi:hypothetical protein